MFDTAVSCSDDDECTIDSCNPATGDCWNVASDCDDGDSCTIDTCDPASDCVNEIVEINDCDLCTVFARWTLVRMAV